MCGFCGYVVAAFLVYAALAAPSAYARAFPVAAPRERFTVIQYPVVKLGRQMLRLAPGGQVRDTTNQIVPPTSLSGTFHSLYTLDNNGDVFRVWLLSDDELAALKAQGR